MPFAPYTAIIVDPGVILSIIDFARGSHPREFTCLLEGKVKDVALDKEQAKKTKDAKEKALVITGLVFQQYESSTEATVTHLDLPLLHNTVGSVHSHPGGSRRPSGTDLRFFNKHGVFHMIIAEPYDEGTIASYDKNGRPVRFSVRRS